MKPQSQNRRWLPLCLGLPGFLFLVWAWIYSNFLTSDFEYRPWGFEAGSCEGHLVIARLSPQAAPFYRVDQWVGAVYSTRMPDGVSTPYEGGLPWTKGSDFYSTRMPEASPPPGEGGLTWTQGPDFTCFDSGAGEDLSFTQAVVYPARRTWWPPPRFQRSPDPKEPFWLLAFPHWALISGYLLIWAGLWQWAVRRSRRRLLQMAR